MWNGFMTARTIDGLVLQEEASDCWLTVVHQALTYFGRLTPIPPPPPPWGTEQNTELCPVPEQLGDLEAYTASMWWSLDSNPHLPQPFFLYKPHCPWNSNGQDFFFFKLGLFSKQKMLFLNLIRVQALVFESIEWGWWSNSLERRWVLIGVHAWGHLLPQELVLG